MKSLVLFSVAFVTALIGGVLWLQAQNPGNTNDTSDSTKSTFSVHQESAIFSGGCFWGVEENFRTIPGVIKTTAGYTGGATANPTYEELNKTGHAEAVKVSFDPARVSYEALLNSFFSHHDPTVHKKQQYHSAIYFQGDVQKQTAERVKNQLNQSGKWPNPIVTEIAEAGPFYPAEEYHQKFYFKNHRAALCNK